jgi:hypothetical protein
MAFAFSMAAQAASTHKGAQIPWSAIGAVASLLLSACSMIVAVWQTRLARRAARIAQDAATATSVQARASVEQANLLRRQLEAEQEDRIRQMEPTFLLRTVEDAEWGTLKGFPCHFAGFAGARDRVV